MEMLRKSVKVIGLSVVLFIILTLLSATLLYITDIKESWGHGMMLISMTISSLFAGVLEAKIVGKRMLFVFLITAILFAAIIYGSIYMIFSFK